MAGGEGRRLRPLTEDMPKPMVPIAAEPCINHIVNLLKIRGIDKIAVTAMYKSDVIKENLLRAFPEIEIRFFEEKTPLGTAGGVGTARSFIDGDFVVISGDAVCDLNINEAVEFHRKKGGIATVVLAEADDPTEYGIVTLDGEGRVLRFTEKPDWSRALSSDVNTGIYVFSRRIFDYIPENEFADFSRDVFPKLISAGEKIYAVKMNFYWKDIGNPQKFLEANSDMLKGLVCRRGSFENHASEHKNAVIIPPCIIGRGCKIGNAEIGPGTVIGDGCEIADGVHISDSVIMDNVTVKEKSHIRRSAVCPGVYIGKNSSVGEDSVIGKNCRIGSGSVVSSGSVLYGNLVYGENSRVSGRNFTLKKPAEIMSGKIVFTEESDLFDVIKRGYSYGRAVKGNVAFAFPERAYSVFSQAFTSAVRDSGNNVYLVCKADFSGLKYIVRNFGFQGGVYMHRENGRTTLHFIDEDGLFLSPEKIRDVWKIYESEDFHTGNGGRLKVFDGFMTGYRHHLERLFSGIENIPVSVIAPSEIMSYLSFSDRKSDEKICISDERLRVFFCGRDGEGEYGRERVALVCLYVFGKVRKKVFIPESFYSGAEKIASENGFETVRLSWNSPDRYLLYDFTDTVSSAAVLLRYLAENHVTFGEISARLPSCFRREVQIDVKNGLKAKIISEISKADGCELTDNGVRIRLPEDSTVSVISSADKNHFRIYAESVREEIASELCDIYVNKIETEAKKVKKDTSE